MPSVTCDGTGNLDDGVLTRFGSDAASVRNGTTAVSFSNTATINIIGHGKVFSNVFIYRQLINFDLGGNDDDGASLSGNTVDSATITVVTLANLTGFSQIEAQTSNLVYLLKIDAGSSFDTGDWDSFDGWVSSGSYTGEATVYGTANEAVSSTLTFNLSSECVEDINSAISGGNDFSIMATSQDDFLSNIGTGGLGSPNTTAGIFADFDGVRINSVEGNASNAFKLNLTYGAATVSHSANFFGANF